MNPPYDRPLTPLSYPMKLTLRDIATLEPSRNINGGWVDTHRHSIPLVSVHALKRRGLVDTDLWYVRLTDEGRAVALALYKHKGDAS